MSRKNNNQPHPFEDTRSGVRAGDQHESQLSTGRNGRRKRKLWPWLLLALIATVFFLPNIIGMTSLKQAALNYGLKDFDGTVSIDTATLGWLQPVQVNNLTAFDRNGQPLLQVKELRTSKTLLSFLTSSDYGQLDVITPVVWLTTRPGGSNWEDALNAWLQPPVAGHEQASTDAPQGVATSQPSTGTVHLPKMTIVVADGAAVIATVNGSETWQIDQWGLTAMTGGESSPLAVETAFRVTPFTINAEGAAIAQPAGIVRLNSEMDSGQTDLTFQSVAASLQTESLPISVAGPLMQRVVGPARTGGSMNADLQLNYLAADQSLQMNVVQADVSDLALVAPDLIGADAIAIRSALVEGQIGLGPKMMVANQFRLQSDFGKLTANGSFDVEQIASLSANPNGESAGLLDTPFQMDGQIDLAGIAEMLPATLQLHDGMEIQSGTITFQAGSRIEEDATRLIVNMDTANLRARRGSETIVWQKPLRLVGTIRESRGVLALEEIRCESDFLTVSGTATPAAGSFAAIGDLDLLMERVGQFVDLQGIHLSGKLNGKLAWQVPNQPETTALNPENLPLQIIGQFQVDHPAFQMPQMPIWRQPQLNGKLSAAGQSTNAGQLRLDQGGVQIDIGSEQLTASLAQPVANAFAQTNWQLDCRLTGTVAGWLDHVQNFVDLGEFQAQGQIEATTLATINNNTIDLANVQFSAQPLQFTGYGVTIQEPQTTGSTNASYDMSSGRLLLRDVVLSSNSIAASSPQLSVLAAEAMQVDGGIAFRADVNRVADWFALSPTDESVYWFGAADGTIDLSTLPDGIAAKVQMNLNDVVAATKQGSGQNAGNNQNPMQPVSSEAQWVEVWREANVKLSSSLALSSDFNSLGFQNTELRAESISADISGRIDDLAGAMNADVSGTWSPDWKQINSLVAAYSDRMVLLDGQGSFPISVSGPLYETAAQPDQNPPLVSPALQAATRLGWQRAQVLGLPVGKADIDLNLQQGIANVNTGPLQFSGGTINLQPQVDLRTDKPVLYLPTGKLVDNVALTPETARQWLKFVAPLAADATSAEGKLSLDVEGLRLPLEDPMAMQTQGVVTLTDIVIGAGPAAERLLASAKQLHALLDPESAGKDRNLSTWLTMERQSVPVAVQDRRVFHQGMKLSHKGMVVSTSGSVGFDQTLDLVAEIPILDEWIEGKSHLASLKGQTISIPVRGTVSKPEVDRRALQQLSSQVVKQAAGQAAGNALNKLVGDKVAPKLNGYQEKVSSKIQQEANKLQNKLQEKLGNKLQTQEGEGLENELIRGLGNLFGN